MADGTVPGNLTNIGSIFARNTAQLVADNINSLGGRIHADSVLASAKTDINNMPALSWPGTR